LTPGGVFVFVLMGFPVEGTLRIPSMLLLDFRLRIYDFRLTPQGVFLFGLCFCNAIVFAVYRDFVL
jgi:hypothetical protein